jgi:hypothetical protein
MTTSRRKYQTLYAENEHPMDGPRRAQHEVNEINDRGMGVLKRTGMGHIEKY